MCEGLFAVADRRSTAKAKELASNNRTPVDGSGTLETVPAVLALVGAAGAEQAMSGQVPSFATPTGPLLTSIVPPADVSPCGGKPPIAVKKKASPERPV